MFTADRLILLWSAWVVTECNDREDRRRNLLCVSLVVSYAVDPPYAKDVDLLLRYYNHDSPHAQLAGQI